MFVFFLLRTYEEENGHSHKQSTHNYSQPRLVPVVAAPHTHCSCPALLESRSTDVQDVATAAVTVTVTTIINVCNGQSQQSVTT